MIRMIRIHIDKETLDKIDDTKSSFKIKIPSYPDAIYKICEILEKEKEINRNFQKIVEKIFAFLQENCLERDYISEDFFQDLLKLHRKFSK